MTSYQIKVTYTATQYVTVVAESLRDAQLQAESIAGDMNKNTFNFNFEKAEKVAVYDIPDDLDPMIEQVKDLMQENEAEQVDVSGVYQRKTRTLYDGEEVVDNVLVDYIFVDDGELTVTYRVSMFDEYNEPDPEPLTELDYDVQNRILQQALESLTD